MRILVLKPSALGDVVQALPVLRLLRRRFVEAEIYWWIDAELRSMVEADPDLDGHFLFYRRRWTAPWHWHEALESIRRMRQMTFDWAIDLQALARSAALAWLVRANLTVGLDDTREGAAAIYDLRVPRPSFTTHAVDWYLAVLKALKVPVHWDFDWLPPRPQVAATVARKWPLDQARWIVLQPGARWPNKRWPIEYYAEVVRRLAPRLPDVRFAILGGGGDHPLGQAITAALPTRCLDLTGSTSLPEMVEWIRASELVLSNDSGPMHVAAALGRPVVALFGPTEPRRTGPYGQLDGVLQVPLGCVPCLKSRCHHTPLLECLHRLEPERVCAEVLRRMAAPPTGLTPRLAPPLATIGPGCH